MIRALLARSLRHHGALFIAIAIGLAAFETLIIEAAAVFESGPGIRFLLDMMPEVVRTTIETQIGLASFASAVAFGFVHPFTLAGGIAFVVMAATIPAGERETKLLDLLLARPVPRRHYLLSSLALMAIGAVVLPLVQLAGAAGALAVIETRGELPWQRYIPCAIGLTALLLAFGGIALLLASGAKRRGPAVSQVVGLALAAYVVEFLADLWPRLEWIRWASPFHYFKPIQSAITPSTPIRNLLVLLGIFAITTLLAFARFNRRDI